MPTPFDHLFPSPPLPSAPAPMMAAPAAAPTAAPVAPAVPSFAPTPMMPPSQPSSGGPGFISAFAPIVASLIGGKDPVAVGAGLAAYTQGQRLKKAEREQDHERQIREQREQAEFYGRVLENAQQFDDPIAFEQWKSAIAPMAKVYGVPLESVVFNDARKAAKDRKLMSDAVDAAVKRLGPDVLDRDDVSIQLADGRTVSMKIARQAYGGAVTDASGKVVPAPAKSPFAGTSPAELQIAAAAKRLGKPVADLTEAEIAAAVAVGKPDTNAPSTADEQMLQTFATEHGFKSFSAMPFALQTEAKQKAAAAGRQAGDPELAAINKNIAEMRLENLRAAKTTQGLPPKIQTQVGVQQRAFDSLPAVKNTQTISEAAAFVEGLDPKTTNPADDQALIYAFAKAMDPNSVVREGEYATVQKYAQSWAQTFGFNAARVFSNTSFLTPEARANMKATIMSRFGASKKQYDVIRQSYGSKIDRLTGQGDGVDYLTDYGAAFPQDPTAPKPTAGAGNGGPKKIRARDPKGVLHEADPGTALPAGWKLEP